MKKGEFIGSFAPYGYMKDPNDKHKLIIDPVASKVVKRIFDLYTDGYGVVSICRLLNDEKYFHHLNINLKTRIIIIYQCLRILKLKFGLPLL